jgi:hypothetical protein
MKLSAVCASIVVGVLLVAAGSFAQAQRGNPAAKALRNPADERWASEFEMHGYFFDQFMESPGNGFSRMGMRPMMIWPTMRLTIECESKDKAMSIAQGQYKLDSLELIGVAKHPSPVAFVTSNHGSYARQTRTLTAFEQEALIQLRGGKTLISRMEDSTHAAVIGTVQAREECLYCHGDYKAGDLLGAFSYRLSAVKPEKSE